jgi:hypothetical protein
MTVLYWYGKTSISKISLDGSAGFFTPGEKYANHPAATAADPPKRRLRCRRFHLWSLTNAHITERREPDQVV